MRLLHTKNNVRDKAMLGKSKNKIYLEYSLLKKKYKKSTFILRDQKKQQKEVKVNIILKLMKYIIYKKVEKKNKFKNWFLMRLMKFENLDEANDFPEKYVLSKLTQKEMEILNRPIAMRNCK